MKQFKIHILRHMHLARISLFSPEFHWNETKNKKTTPKIMFSRLFDKKSRDYAAMV